MNRLHPTVAFLLLLLLHAVPVFAEPVDFTLPDLQGEPRSLSEFRGKWVVVNYWATWCPPCLDELPELEMFHAAHSARDAVVVGVNLEEITPARLKGFIDDQFISYPILLGEQGQKTALGRVTGLPTTYLVTPEGEVVARQVGPVDKTMLESYIDNYKKRKIQKEE